VLLVDNCLGYDMFWRGLFAVLFCYFCVFFGMVFVDWVCVVGVLGFVYFWVVMGVRVLCAGCGIGVVVDLWVVLI